MESYQEVELAKERITILSTFSQALTREAHVLNERPDLLWQQLFNRLQWEEKPIPAILAPEIRLRSATGATPWLRLKSPYRESEMLIRTLEGHKSGVRACACSPDGTQIVKDLGC